MKLQNSWETRARQYGPALRSVLFKGMPAAANEYLNDWHRSEVFRAATEAGLREGETVLDLGCGYGRLSEPVRTACPGARLIGLDVSRTFASQYSRLGAGVVCDLGRVPLKQVPLRLVVAVTVFMYLSATARADLLEYCLRGMVPGGRILLIENSSRGYRIARWGSRPSSPAATTGSVAAHHYFDVGEIAQLVTACGGCIHSVRGVPAFTRLVPLVALVGMCGLGRVARAMLSACKPVVCADGASLHMAYIVEKV